MLFRLKDETQTVAEEWTLLVAAACLNANEQPSLSPFSHLPNTQTPPPLCSLPPPSTTSSSSSCSESSLQFVPLPHTSLFKMTLLHFTANQLFCLTQSTGSASQPARINWGAAAVAATALCVRRERTSGGGDGEAVRGKVGGLRGLGWVARRLIVLSLTSPQGWSEQLETETAVLGRRRGRQRRARGRRGGNNTGGCCAEWRDGGGLR